MKPLAIPVRQVAVQEITGAPSRLRIERTESETKLAPLRVVHEANESLYLSFAAALIGERTHEG
jgi:hypothetical protein